MISFNNIKNCSFIIEARVNIFIAASKMSIYWPCLSTWSIIFIRICKLINIIDHLEHALAPCEFRKFSMFKKVFCGCHFVLDNEVMNETHTFLSTLSTGWFLKNDHCETGRAHKKVHQTSRTIFKESLHFSKKKKWYRCKQGPLWSSLCVSWWSNECGAHFLQLFQQGWFLENDHYEMGRAHEKVHQTSKTKFQESLDFSKWKWYRCKQCVNKDFIFVFFCGSLWRVPATALTQTALSLHKINAQRRATARLEVRFHHQTMLHSVVRHCSSMSDTISGNENLHCAA